MSGYDADQAAKPKRVVVMLAGGGEEVWSAERDGLASISVHPSGALLIYVYVNGVGPAAGVRLRAARSFGTWIALEIDPPSAA